MKRTCSAEIKTFVTHTAPLPPCCPISGNPLEGSAITVCYMANGTVFPVEDLSSFIAEYVGGHEAREVRNMEEMIQDLAIRVRDEVGVPVRAYADLIIRPPYGGDTQKMRVSVRAK